MARTQKDTVDYFPHDAKVDGEVGDTLAVLEGQFGNDGYTFWYKLMERLACSEGHFIDCNNSKKWQLLLARARINHETTVEMMNLLVEMGAIDKELWQQYKIIWCQSLVDNVADVYKNRKRELPKKPNPLQLKLNLASNANITTVDKGVSTGKMPITTPKSTQSKVKESKVKESKVLPPKGGQRKAQSNTTKEKKDSVINEIFSEMRRFLGYPEDKVCGPGSPTPGEKKEAKVCGGEAVPAIEESSAGDARSKREKGAVDPIPNYGREGRAIKRMLTRGFTREEILACWESKVSQRGGEFVSMTWVNEDIGKGEKQKRKLKELSTEEEIAASIKEVAL